MIRNIICNYYLEGSSYDFFGDDSLVLSSRSVDVNSFPVLDGVVWIHTSGSTGAPKWVALRKDSFKISADIFNHFFKLNVDDSWLHSLPLYHVGGLSILFRAFVAKQKIYAGIKQDKWNPSYFYQQLIETKSSLTSIVPTQLFDLVNLKLMAPKTLKYVFIGGANLEDKLYQQAIELGWPIIRSYGMTETCAMIAAEREVGSGKLTLFPQWKMVDTNSEGLMIQGPCLLEGYWNGVNWTDPKAEGSYLASDVGRVVDGCLELQGRVDDIVKVLGEKVSKTQLARDFSAFFQMDHELICLAVADARRGYQLYIVIESRTLSLDLTLFNKTQSGPSKVEKVFFLEQFPRTALGKILIEELKSKLAL